LPPIGDRSNLGTDRKIAPPRLSVIDSIVTTPFCARKMVVAN
jgi:hypothetical protein